MDGMKKFLIIGNSNAVTYKEIFPLIKNNQLWLGMTLFCGKMPYFEVPKEFVTENDRVIEENGKILKQVNSIAWFTNLDNNKRHEELPLYKSYNSTDYPTYDNYDAIECNKVQNIPYDYDGVIGVPITFLDKYNPNQFEIIGQMANTKVDEYNMGYPFINKKKKYARILIRRKK